MDYINEAKKVFMNTYSPFPIVLDHGDGVYLYDENNKKYLDFTAGIAVNALGYQDKDLNNALIEQIGKIMHCSNLYYTKPAVEAAKLLVEKSGLDRVFFCNSGAEANEGAIKLAKKYAVKNKGEECTKIITMQQSFHGRTIGALTATGQTKYQKGFGPLLPGVCYVPYNDYDSLASEVDNNVCAIVIEPIQGEGGIYEVDTDYLTKVRKLCDENNIVLIFDEVQCGIGRTGELFAFQTYGVTPDIVTLAKGLGAGVPVGGMIAKEKIASAFEPGNHASTFGGNPLVTTAVKTVITKVSNKEFLEHVKEVGDYLQNSLQDLVDKYECIVARRGKGLMQGIELSITPKDVISKAIEKGLLIISASTNVIRFVPPLVIEKEHVDEMINILDEIFGEL